MNDNDKYKTMDIKIDSNVSKVTLSDAPLGKNRQDKGVTVTDSDGKVQKTSTVMLGYNKDNIKLDNGDYVSEDEISKALDNLFKENSENKVIISRKTGKVIDPLMLKTAVMNGAKKSGSLFLGSGSDKIKNQTTMSISLKGKEMTSAIKKGLLMLGNKGLKMPCGEYLLMSEIEKGLNDYVFREKEEENKQEEDKIIKEEKETKDKIIHLSDEREKRFFKTENKNDNEVRKVVKRKNVKLKLWPLVLSVAIILTMGINIQKVKADIDIEKISSNLAYTINGMYDEPLSVNAYDYSLITTGHNIYVNDDVSYYESSDYNYGGKDSTGTFGGTVRESGNYIVDYFSILYKGQIIKTVMDNGCNLDDEITSVINEKGIDDKDLEIMIHIGGPVSGWVNYNDLKDAEDINLLVSKISLDEAYTGSVKDYKKENVTINTDSGIVSLSLSDNDGNLLKEGTTVIGSDGEQYKISSLKEEQIFSAKPQDREATYNINYRINDAKNEARFVVGLLGIAGTLFSKKKKIRKDEVTEDEYKEMFQVYKKDNSKKNRLISMLTGINPIWKRRNSKYKSGQYITNEISDIGEDEQGKGKRR